MTVTGSPTTALWSPKGLVPTGMDAQQVIIQSRPFDEIPSGLRTRCMSVYVSYEMERFIAELATQHGVSRSTAIYGLVSEGLRARMAEDNPALKEDYQLYSHKSEVAKRQRIRRDLEALWENMEDWDPETFEARERDCQAMAKKYNMPWPPVITAESRPVDLSDRRAWRCFEMLLKLKEGTENARVSLREIYRCANMEKESAQEAMNNYPEIQSEVQARTVWYWL